MIVVNQEAIKEVETAVTYDMHAPEEPRGQRSEVECIAFEERSAGKWVVSKCST